MTMSYDTMYLDVLSLLPDVPKKTSLTDLQYHIRCWGCNHVITVNMPASTSDIALSLKVLGWRRLDDNIVCPICAANAEYIRDGKSR